MKRVLVLGAGLVARPLVAYLLDNGFAVTVADQVHARAAQRVGDHPHGRAVELDAGRDPARLDEGIAAHDLVVSLLPAPLHPDAAARCVRRGRPLVTASYISPAMRALDAPARAAGVLLLNELGLDPGIDHMAAMRVIDDLARRGGRVSGFRSYCGGLPAPDANDNPWGYKFSWSPRGVCTAGKNPARWLEDGRTVDVSGPALFRSHHAVAVSGVPGHAALEGYPNRDALGYIATYGLRDMRTMFRGTLRYPGWSACMQQIVDFGLLDEEPVTYRSGTSFAQWTAGFLARRTGTECAATGRDLRARVADGLRAARDADFLDRWEWLGLFSEEPLPLVETPTTALDVLAARLAQKLPYRPGERDMVVLMHDFVAEFPPEAPAAPPRTERISSTLVDFGRPHGDSAMARTVSLPAAIAVKLILTDQLPLAGVHAPVAPELYRPVLDELAALGIRCIERTH